jgi:hypothetical protein
MEEPSLGSSTLLHPFGDKMAEVDMDTMNSCVRSHLSIEVYQITS